MTQRAYNNADEAMVQFRHRLEELQDELRAINHELGRPDFLALADQTREVLRRTRSLLDANINILFAHQPERIPENLHKHVEYAQAHLDKALGEEYEFEAIVKRLYMVAALTQYVIHAIEKAVEEISWQ
jgi:hypothetical protein